MCHRGDNVNVFPNMIFSLHYPHFKTSIRYICAVKKYYCRQTDMTETRCIALPNIQIYVITKNLADNLCHLPT